MHLDTVRAAIRGIVLNDVKAEVSSYSPEMAYLSAPYSGDARSRKEGRRPQAPAAAAFGRRS